MEIEQNNTYIFKYKMAAFRAPSKGLIKEVTETTLLIENLDSNTTYRTDKQKFIDEYEISELVQDFNKDILESLKGNSIKIIENKNYTFKTFTQPCWNRSCFCDGSCKVDYGYSKLVYTGPTPKINFEYSI